MSYNDSLSSTSNYPPMSQSEWDNAPWNEQELPEKEFEVTISQTLSKTVPVFTNNYIPGESGTEYELNDEGVYSPIGYQDPDDTSNINWGEEYHSNDYHTPKQLISLFCKFLQEQKEKGNYLRSEEYTDWIIDECGEWSDDETEYIES